MRTTFNSLSLVHQLVACGERQLKNEKKAQSIIEHVLKTHSISYTKQSFSVRIPQQKKATVTADGKAIPCEACSFSSGTINDKDVIVSSSMPSIYFQSKPNINFNPSCPVISRGNYYTAPAVAISHASLQEILKAKKVSGSVKIELTKHTSSNILVGNTHNPRVVCFSHYDSIGPGAIDNASGVAVMMDLLLNNTTLQKDALFVFSGCEELSTDRPFYWGHGFRVLQKRHPAVFAKAQKIIVIDCVGNGKTQTITDPSVISRAFPIEQLEKLSPKIKLVVGDIEHLMTVYHSPLDDGRGMSHAYLQQAVRHVKQLLT